MYKSLTSEIISADPTNIQRIEELEQLYANKFYNVDGKCQFLKKHKLRISLF